MSYYKSQSYDDYDPSFEAGCDNRPNKYYEDDCYDDCPKCRQRPCPKPCPPPCPRPCPQPCPSPCPSPCPYPPYFPPICPVTPGYFLAATVPVTLTTVATPLAFLAQRQTANVTGISPTLTFNQIGRYLIQLCVPLTTTSTYIGTGSLFISPVTSGNISVSPSDFISTPLVAGITNVKQVYYVIANVTTPGATLSFNVGLTAAATSGFAVLGTGQITAYALA